MPPDTFNVTSPSEFPVDAFEILSVTTCRGFGSVTSKSDIDTFPAASVTFNAYVPAATSLSVEVVKLCPLASHR